MYAKPKRGKTAQGEWKDIVNVKDYTQTPRRRSGWRNACIFLLLIDEGNFRKVEYFFVFRKPGGGCSYVSHHYKSQCSQV